HGGVWCAAFYWASACQFVFHSQRVTVRQARSVLGVCKPGRCRARAGCAFGCWLRPFGSGSPVTRSAQIRTPRKVFGRRRASFGAGGLIFGTIAPPPLWELSICAI